MMMACSLLKTRRMLLGDSLLELSWSLLHWYGTAAYASPRPVRT
jgi:hypothetical protein